MGFDRCIAIAAGIGLLLAGLPDGAAMAAGGAVDPTAAGWPQSRGPTRRRITRNDLALAAGEAVAG